MGKLSFKQSGTRYIIRNRLQNMETINERAVNAIAGGMFPGLAGLVIKRKRKGNIIEVVIQDAIPLKIYLSGIVSKKTFLNAMQQIVKTVKLCDTSMINPNNLDLNTERIFVKPRTKEIICILWPVVNNELCMSCANFFREIPKALVFDRHEDNRYLTEYTNFFANIYVPFSIYSFERLLCCFLGESKPEVRAPSGAMGGFQEKGEEAIPKENAVYDPFVQFTNGKNTSEKTENGGFFCPECGEANATDSNFCCKCGKKLTDLKGNFLQKQESIVSVDTGKLSTIAGGTIVLGYDMPEEPTYPYLVREGTGDKVAVDKLLFRIGKERQYCDYFISDNDTISRRHANIITQEGRYFIIDLHSTNRTYVDDCAIPIEQEVEIFSGTKIRLANEDFTFLIET